MAEYIEREAVLDLLTNRDVVINPNDEVANIREDIERLPAADVRPVVRALWEEFGEAKQKFYSCSNCFATHYRWDNFCPNCGAMMEES